MDAALTAVATKAEADHTHTLDEVNGLPPALDAKADSVHDHALVDLTDVNAAGAAVGQILGKVGPTSWGPIPVDASSFGAYNQGQIDDLLAAKADLDSPAFTGSPLLPPDTTFADPPASRRALVTGHALQGLAAQNMAVNSFCQVSQENGNNPGGAASAFWPVDQTLFGHVGGWPGQYVGRRTDGLGVDGLGNVIWLMTDVSGSVAANDFAYLGQRIEANRLAPLRLGTPSAIPSLHVWVLRAAHDVTVAGSVRNPDATRNYVYDIPLSAGVATVHVQEVPADTQQTPPPAGNTTGLRSELCARAGSGFRAPAGAWADGASISTLSADNYLTATSHELRVVWADRAAQDAGVDKRVFAVNPDSGFALVDAVLCGRPARVPTLLEAKP